MKSVTGTSQGRPGPSRDAGRGTPTQGRKNQEHTHPRRTDGRAARWDQHRQQRKRELLRAIRHVVSVHGPDVSMETIAHELDIAKTILYRYFGDRAGLEAAMGDWAKQAILKHLDQVKVDENSPRAALTSLIRAFVDLAARAPHVYRFCDRGVHVDGNDSENFFDTTATLLCTRMNLHSPSQRMWARGALGFVRSCTDAWLVSPHLSAADFTHQISDWLWASAPLDNAACGPRHTLDSTATNRLGLKGK